MQAFKWGNGLAVCLPDIIIETLKLKEGDEVEVSVARALLDLTMDGSRKLALERIQALRKELPADWKFDREEANRR
jgi:antitoxin MazE